MTPQEASKWRLACTGRGRRDMIQLTRLNNQPLMVNSDLIKFVEKAPDTVLTLVNGEKLVVLESAEAILEKIVVFRRSIVPVPRLNLPEHASETSGSATADKQAGGEIPLTPDAQES
jgi:flagellar protein FlbD